MHAITSIIYAATDCFGGWLSLGCCNGSLHLSSMIFSSLDFAVTRREPSGFAKLRGTAHSGYSKAYSKFTTLLVFEDSANIVPSISLLTSTAFIRALPLIATFLLVVLNSCSLRLEIELWNGTDLYTNQGWRQGRVRL